jgi:hypothetical protein
MVDMVKVGEWVIDFGIFPRGVVNFAHVEERAARRATMLRDCLVVVSMF